jgi:hypothetical protein
MSDHEWVDIDLLETMKSTNFWYKKLIRDPHNIPLKKEYHDWLTKLSKMKIEKWKEYIKNSFQTVPVTLGRLGMW